ncbi:hypothetical protein PGSY75_0916900 [Plasmodium gaboni]|uniref:HIT-type domain-containing protein n=1 Tax=Plasmodium gaboni TaxID=647221 RepID=A0A151LLP5_9APIC|nr:hypothetical protein PGSY75_0916900 [Plasmodium gaboni]KYO00155.1 hypothetical protein PGSY75_0916900 [Plasmodium gaboni]
MDEYDYNYATYDIDNFTNNFEDNLINYNQIDFINDNIEVNNYANEFYVYDEDVLEENILEKRIHNKDLSNNNQYENILIHTSNEIKTIINNNNNNNNSLLKKRKIINDILLNIKKMKKNDTLCIICSKNEKKYTFTCCYQYYCSLECFKKHDQQKCRSQNKNYNKNNDKIYANYNINTDNIKNINHQKYQDINYYQNEENINKKHNDDKTIQNTLQIDNQNKKNEINNINDNNTPYLNLQNNNQSTLLLNSDNITNNNENFESSLDNTDDYTDDYDMLTEEQKKKLKEDHTLKILLKNNYVRSVFKQFTLSNDKIAYLSHYINDPTIVQVIDQIMKTIDDT